MPINLDTPEVIIPQQNEVTTSRIEMGKVIIESVLGGREVSVEILDSDSGCLLRVKSFKAVNAVNNIISQIEQYFISQGWINGSQV